MSLEMAVKGIEIRWISDPYSSVMALRNFSKGEIIEVAPIIMLNQRDSSFIESTKLLLGCFRFGENNLVLPGGYATVYLSSEKPNASYGIFPEQRALAIVADQDIREGEFIYVNRGEFSQPIEKIKVEYNERAPWFSDGLVVKPSPGKGLGVFATKRFQKGDLLEVCHLFCLTERQSYITEETVMNHYMYSTGSKGQIHGWAVGYSCFFNHSDKPNITPWDQLEYLEEMGYEHLAVRALKDIEPGTELMFDYSDGLGGKNLWFDIV